MTFDNCSCFSPNPRYFSVLSCGLGKNHKRRTFTIELKFTTEIKRWFLNMKITLPHKPNDFVLLNLSNIDGCKLLENKNQVTLLQLGRNNLDRYSNVPKNCPFLKDTLYYVRGFRFDLQLLPALRFETETHVFYQFIAENKNLIQGYVQNRITWRKGKN